MGQSVIRKILVANRGEIACRVMRTAHRLGIATVAVHSDADARALHVTEADEAVHIGPSPAAESYLRIEHIIEAARTTGADAIHPGYGFLAENAEFAEAVSEAGLVFIGPPATAIRAMGLKDGAKRLMQEAGVPVVPGYHGDDQESETLAAQAEAIGYPVLIKARAGGGGKGMRAVDDPEDFEQALAGARREAKASFGDDAVIIERLIGTPRHIEIQVFADTHGEVVHLFERDCSLQRRHQKVIEEAPAPGMTSEMREAMGNAAVRAAAAIGYVGAGTVEFIVDGGVREGLAADRFWFMEMNTRLQVEHPVTEMITGQDLVEWQIRVAMGEPLPLTQADLRIDGWAMEARIYAEDAARGFLPATGRLHMLRFPRDLARVDSGVCEGDSITPFYDPMIAKLVVHGPTRAVALARLEAALGQCRIAGSVTNVGFLRDLIGEPDFARGRVDTGLIERHLRDRTGVSEPPEAAMALAAIVALGLARRPSESDPWGKLTGWRLWSEPKQFALLEYQGRRIELMVTGKGLDRWQVQGRDTSLLIRLAARLDDAVRLDVAGHLFEAAFSEHGAQVTVFLDGDAFEFSMPDRLEEEDEVEAGGDALLAPMPGRVVAIEVAADDLVTHGDTLLVLEAMKMEHALKAPRDGTVASVLVVEGQLVEEGSVLLTLVEEGEREMNGSEA